MRPVTVENHSNKGEPCFQPIENTTLGWETSEAKIAKVPVPVPEGCGNVHMQCAAWNLLEAK